MSGCRIEATWRSDASETSFVSVQGIAIGKNNRPMKQVVTFGVGDVSADSPAQEFTVIEVKAQM